MTRPSRYIATGICARAGCRRLFAGVQGQRYCSRSCARKAEHLARVAAGLPHPPTQKKPACPGEPACR